MIPLLAELAASRAAQKRQAAAYRRRSLVAFFRYGPADAPTLAQALGVGTREALDLCYADLELGILEYIDGRLSLTALGRAELALISGDLPD